MTLGIRWSLPRAGNQLLLALAKNPIRWLLFASFTRRLTLPLGASIAAPVRLSQITAGSLSFNGSIPKGHRCRRPPREMADSLRRSGAVRGPQPG